MGDILEKAGLITAAEITRPKFGHTFADTNEVLADVPEEWRGRRVRFTATKPVSVTTEAVVSILFGDASVVVDPVATSGGSLPAWTTNTQIGDKIAANESIDLFMEHTFTHFSAQCDVAGITLTGVVSDLPSVAREIVDGY